MYIYNDHEVITISNDASICTFYYIISIGHFLSTDWMTSFTTPPGCGWTPWFLDPLVTILGICMESTLDPQVKI